MEIDNKKLEENLPDGDFSGFLVLSENHFGENEDGLNPSGVKEEVKEFSDELGIDPDYTFDLLSPVFSSKKFKEFKEDEYLDVEEIIDKSKTEGENMSDEENEEVQELEDKVKTLEGELEDKEESIQEYEEKIENYEEKIEDYEETIEEFEQERKEAIVDDIVSLKQEKDVYDDEDDIEDDREELSEKSKEVLEEVLNTVEDIPTPEPEVSDESFSKVKETEEDFEEKDDEKKKLEKDLFGDNKAYT